MNVNQYGHIHFKTMVKFVIDNSVQFETKLYSLGCLSVNASVHFKQNYVTPFTVLYNGIVRKTAIVRCNCNNKLNHTILSYNAFDNTSDF